jgi:DNA-binding transcriptional LysR family regulator
MEAHGALTLQLLHTLELLLRTRSVSRTADALGQTQSAVSVSLRRLREALSDPLLVRSGNHLVPTSRAQALEQPLRDLLAQFGQVLRNSTGFDPAVATRSFSLATADCMQSFFLPRLVGHLRALAPHISLQLRPLSAQFDFPRALADGSLDAVIGNWPDPPPHLRQRMLLEDRMICLVRPGHPLADTDALDLATYLRLEHVAPEPFLSSAPGPVDGALARLGAKRRIAVTVPEFGLASYLVADSDLVFTSSSHYGQHYADLLGLRVVQAPPELEPMRFYLLWHDCAQVDPASLWLRQQIAWVGAALGGKADGPV